LRKQILTCAKIKTHVKEGKLFPRSALTEGGGGGSWGEKFAVRLKSNGPQTQGFAVRPQKVHGKLLFTVSVFCCRAPYIKHMEKRFFAVRPK
jgi:hypothetical protein